MNVLVLYDPKAVFINTVREHIESFGRYSRHRVSYAPAAAKNPLTVDVSAFEVIIIHYSIRLSYDWHLSPEYAWALKRFRGVKVAFIQDEYDHTWRTCQWLDQLDVRLVFTCVPQEHVRAVYSKVNHARIQFVTTLTGYLPIDSDLGKHVKPLADRNVVIGYRGRELPFHYGQLAREKLMIGIRMRAECEARGIKHDIEWTEGRRIYGAKWVDFIASCRATLGTESGSNVFDFDGSLCDQVDAALKKQPNLTYEQVEERFLRGREMTGVMNQVSPRIFEAVALRTGLILFEGTYSGVVRPDEHFVPLKKDFSNVEEVLRRVQDDRELQAMTDRAYANVIGSGAYTYAAFIREVDTALDRIAGTGRESKGLTTAADGSRDVQSTAPTTGVWKSRLRGIPIIDPALRTARNGLRGIYAVLGLKALRAAMRYRRGAAELIRREPDLAELLRTGPAPGGKRSLKREIVRLALLKHACQDCPTIRAPIWTTIRLEFERGRVTFTSHPVHDLPVEIASGQPTLDRVIAGVQARQVREFVWDFPIEPRKLEVKMDNAGIVPFDLGADRIFRFTALERLADQDPERAARLLALVGAGASASAEAMDSAGEYYRQAS